MSETLPEPSNDSSSAMPASLRNSSATYGAPGHVWLLSSPLTVVSPASSRREASIETSAANASGVGPPNIPE